MLWLIAIVLLVLVIVFAVLSFAVHHLFLIALVVAGLLLLGHGGFLARRNS